MELIRGSWRRKWPPTPIFLPEEFHGQGSLAKDHGVTVSHARVTNRHSPPLGIYVFPPFPWSLSKEYLFYVAHCSFACLSLLLFMVEPRGNALVSSVSLLKAYSDPDAHVTGAQ